MKVYKLYIFMYIVILMSASSCTPIHRGYKFEDDDAVTLQQMVEKKANINQIINKFGSPRFINSPINDTLCYIDADGKKVAFNRFFKPNYQFMCVFFNEKTFSRLYNHEYIIHKAKRKRFFIKIFYGF